MESQKVKDYMSRNVIIVSPDQSLDGIIKIMQETNHDGFPVVEGRSIIGIITTRDLVIHMGTRVRDVMTEKVTVTFPDTNLIDAARVMFRKGFSRLPVVDKDGNLVGIVTNTDVIRSHIERATPAKVKKLQKSLEKLYNIGSYVRIGTIKILDLRPTQNKIQPDEFRGREYELKRGLAEPIVVISVGNRIILVDGHHRALAAKRLGIKEIDAYIIVLDKDIELGMERTARAMGLDTIDDIKIVDEGERGVITRIVGGKNRER
ncbi:carnitine transport ATP-binding protein OpuCA [archaeon]|nr:carnitine transport ATP-binding protein OpuCA [archaeon]